MTTDIRKKLKNHLSRVKSRYLQDFSAETLAGCKKMSEPGGAFFVTCIASSGSPSRRRPPHRRPRTPLFDQLVTVLSPQACSILGPGTKPALRSFACDACWVYLDPKPSSPFLPGPPPSATDSQVPGNCVFSLSTCYFSSIPVSICFIVCSCIACRASICCASWPARLSPFLVGPPITKSLFFSLSAIFSCI